MAHSSAGWRIVAGAVAPVILRCRAVESMLEVGAPIRSPDDLGPALAKDIAPIDDIRSTKAYRETVVARVIYHALRGKAPGIV